MGGGDELHDLPDLSKLLNDGIVHILPPAEPRLHGKVLSSGSSDVSLGSKDPRVKKHNGPPFNGALHVILLGRECIICCFTDDSDDPCFAGLKRLWGYPPDPVTGKTSGYVCYYCMRVFNARFKANWILSCNAYLQTVGCFLVGCFLVIDSFCIRTVGCFLVTPKYVYTYK